MDLHNSRTETPITNASLHIHDTDTIKKNEYNGAHWVEVTSAKGQSTMGFFVHSRNLGQVREFAAALLQTCYDVEARDQ